MRRRTFLRSFGATLQSIFQRPGVALSPLHRRPTADQVVRWDTSRERGFLYQVEVQTRIRGTDVIETRQSSARSRRPITFGEALDTGIAFFDDEGETYNEEVLGGVVVGVYELVPEQ